MSAPDIGLAPWNPPAPKEIPEWRAQMVEHSRTTIYMKQICEVVNLGRSTLLPVVPDLLDQFTLGAVAGPLLAKMETKRLAEAELFSVDADMTALAIAASAAPHQGKITWPKGIPETGLMVFDAPIGGHRENFRDVIRGTMADYDEVDAWVTTPIVAVSWSPWSAKNSVHLTSDNAPGQAPKWVYNSPDGIRLLGDHYDGVWMNFYTCSEDRYELLPEDTVVGLGPDGKPMTAGSMREVTKTTMLTPLTWDNETMVPLGIDWPTVEKDTTDEWLSVVWTAWQLMTHKGQVAEIEEVPRLRQGRKRDRREGISDSGNVSLVRVHPRRRPTAAQREQDAEQSTGRREPHYSCRFPVKLYRQDKCMAPRLHKDGDCWHDPDHIVLPHIKGPEGAPFKVREKVNLFDRMPS